MCISIVFSLQSESISLIEGPCVVAWFSHWQERESSLSLGGTGRNSICSEGSSRLVRTYEYMLARNGYAQPPAKE